MMMSFVRPEIGCGLTAGTLLTLAKPPSGSCSSSTVNDRDAFMSTYFMSHKKMTLLVYLNAA